LSLFIFFFGSIEVWTHDFTLSSRHSNTWAITLSPLTLVTLKTWSCFLPCLACVKILLFSTFCCHCEQVQAIISSFFFFRSLTNFVPMLTLNRDLPVLSLPSS
jgi:hypothetical protein